MKKIKNYIKENGVGQFIWSCILVFLIFITSACLLFALYIIISAPNFDKEALYSKESTIIYWADGTEMVRIGQENRQLVSYSDLPQVYIDALLATEDSRFFQHNGLDVARFLKASFGQVIGNDQAGGASTLTMQLVKKNYTDDTAHGIKGIIRKFTDIYMAVFKIENTYTKEEIMEFYVNSLWLGQDNNINTSGIFGVETASQYYFGKSISEVNLAEASILAGLYQNAVWYNPYVYPENCRERQKVVLKLMVNHGYITQEEMDAVLDIPISSLLSDGNTSKNSESNESQDVIDYVRAEVVEKTGKNPFQTPMKIWTKIDKNKQDVLNDLENSKIWQEYATEDNTNIDQEAVVITSVEDGSVVALSAGRNYAASGNNRATTITNQPGSSIKPIIDYAPYFEYLNGSPGDYIFDHPYTYSNGTSIQNANYNQYQGMITIRQALAQSLNIPALQVFQKVMDKDPSLIPNLLHSVGIDYGDTLYESASIGGFDGVTPLQMSAIYGMFGRGGYYIEPYTVTKIEYEDGSTFEYKPEKKRVLSAETCYMITSILIDMVRNDNPGHPLTVSGTEIAGKTGTTSLRLEDQQALGVPDGTTPDNWFITYDPEYAIAFWYGYDIITSEHYSSLYPSWALRAQVMQTLATQIYSPNKKFSRPSGVISVEVEANTNPLQLPSAYTPKDKRTTVLFKEGTEPTETSIRYVGLEAPTNGSAKAGDNKVTLRWDAIDTPKAIDPSYLQKQFNEYYGRWANTYYEKRLSENDSQFGGIGYQVYLRNSNGTLTDLGWYSDTSYTQSVEPGQKYTFVIKSAYRNFKDNASEGLVINFTAPGSSTNPDKDVEIPGLDDNDNKDDNKPDDDVVVQKPDKDQDSNDSNKDKDNNNDEGNTTKELE